MYFYIYFYVNFNIYPIRQIRRRKRAVVVFAFDRPETPIFVVFEIVPYLGLFDYDIIRLQSFFFGNFVELMGCWNCNRHGRVEAIVIEYDWEYRKFFFVVRNLFNEMRISLCVIVKMYFCIIKVSIGLY